MQEIEELKAKISSLEGKQSKPIPPYVQLPKNDFLSDEQAQFLSVLSSSENMKLDRVAEGQLVVELGFEITQVKLIAGDLQDAGCITQLFVPGSGFMYSLTQKGRKAFKSYSEDRKNIPI